MIASLEARGPWRGRSLLGERNGRVQLNYLKQLAERAGHPLDQRRIDGPTRSRPRHKLNAAIGVRRGEKIYFGGGETQDAAGSCGSQSARVWMLFLHYVRPSDVWSNEAPIFIDLQKFIVSELRIDPVANDHCMKVTEYLRHFFRSCKSLTG